MSLTPWIRFMIIFIRVLALVLILLAAASHAEETKVNQVRGEIVSLDIGNGTLVLKTSDIDGVSREIAFRISENTGIAVCGVGLQGGISGLKPGDKVVVSYYAVENEFYAVSVSPKELC